VADSSINTYGSTLLCIRDFGGPLVNAKGEVVGINTRGLAHGRAVTVPVATVNRVVDELLERGHIAWPYMGVAMQPVSVPENARAKLPAETRVGLLVTHVENGAPAEKAGVLLGDMLFEVGGKAVEHADALQDSIRGAKVGDILQIKLENLAQDWATGLRIQRGSRRSLQRCCKHSDGLGYTPETEARNRRSAIGVALNDSIFHAQKFS
jgi:hypothetical protein